MSSTPLETLYILFSLLHQPSEIFAKIFMSISVILCNVLCKIVFYRLVTVFIVKLSHFNGHVTNEKLLLFSYMAYSFV